MTLFARRASADADTVPRRVYEDVRALNERLSAELSTAYERLERAWAQLADASRHAPRGETGRQPRQAPPASMPSAPPAPVIEGLPKEVEAAAIKFAFGDERQATRNAALAAGWIAGGMDARAAIDRIARGEHVEAEEP